MTVHPVRTSTYQVSFAGDATHKAATSTVAKVSVKSAVLLTSPKSGTRTTTRTVKVAGHVNPVKAGTVVTLYEVRSNGTLAYLAAAKVATNGTFVLTKTLAKGTHHLTVTVAATTTNLAGRSSTITLYEV